MSGVLESVTGFFHDHASGITAGMSIIGLVGTVILAVRATPEAYDIYLDACDALEDAETEQEAKEIKKEAGKKLVKNYIPAIAAGIATGVSIVATKEFSFDAGKAVGLGITEAAVYSAVSEYRAETRKAIGERKEEEIYEEVVKNHAREHLSDRPIILSSNSGDYLCFDTAGGTFFRANHQKIRDAILNVNDKLMNEDEATVADLYSELGIPYGLAQEKLYWHIKNGLIKEYYDHAKDDNNEPYLIIDYYTEPKEKERR